MASVRFSCQRAAPLIFRATHAVKTSGGDNPRLAPKEPPTSGTTTRTFSGLNSKTRHRPSRTACALCVVDHCCSDDPSQREIAPRLSMGQGATRLLTIRCFTTTSQSSKSDSSLPVVSSREILVGVFSSTNTRSATASSVLMMGSRSSYSTTTSSAASIPSLTASETTIAIISPT